MVEQIKTDKVEKLDLNSQKMVASRGMTPKDDGSRGMTNQVLDFTFPYKLISIV